jgi:hypothetical protein
VPGVPLGEANQKAHDVGMNKVERLKPHAGYDQDFALWSAEQAELIRAGRFDAIDRENIAEEIESLGRSDRREIARRLGVLLEHLLKWQYQPSKRKPGWRSTIREQRGQIVGLVKESPSLKGFPGKVLSQEYEFARERASDVTGLPLKGFPQTCTYELHDILDPEFFPGESWQRNEDEE